MPLLEGSLIVGPIEAGLEHVENALTEYEPKVSPGPAFGLTSSSQ